MERDRQRACSGGPRSWPPSARRRMIRRRPRRPCSRRRRHARVEPQPTARSRTTSHASPPSGACRRGVGRPVAVLADLPGPKIRDGAVPRGRRLPGRGPPGQAGAGHGRQHRRPHRRSATRRCSTTRARRPVALGDGARPMRIEEREADHFVARVVAAGRVQGRPGAHLPSRAPAGVHPDRAGPGADRGAGLGRVDFVAISFVRRAAEDVHTVRRAVGGGAQHRRQDRDRGRRRPIWRRSPRSADAIMVARGDLGVECPHRGGSRTSRSRSCASAWRGAAGHHRHADARVDDHRAAPTPRRGQRRGQRRVRRDRRRDALGRDGHRARPRLWPCDDGPHPGAAPSTRRTTRLGRAAGHDAAAQRRPASSRITAAMSHAAWQVAARGRRPPPSCAAPARGRTARAMARFRPACPLIGLSPDPRDGQRPRAVVGRRSARRSRSTRRADEMVSFAVETALQPATSRAATSCSCWPARRTHRERRGDRRAAGRAVGDGTLGSSRIWSSRRPATRRPAASCSCTARWTARPGLLKLSRRLEAAIGCCATTGGGTAGPTPHPGPYGSTTRWTTSSRARRCDRRCGPGTATAGTSRSPPPTVTRTRAGVVVYESPLPWADWWPRTSAGSQAVRRGHLGRRGRGVHAADDRDEPWDHLPRGGGTAVGGPGDGRGISSTADERPVDPSPIAGPAVALRGSEGRPHHQASKRSPRRGAWHCPVVDIAGAKHFGPNTHPDAVAAVIVELVSQRTVDRDVAANNVQVVLSTARWPRRAWREPRRRSPAGRHAATTRRRRWRRGSRRSRACRRST